MIIHAYFKHADSGVTGWVITSLWLQLPVETRRSCVSSHL